MLQELGIPVWAERGPTGGYRLRPGDRLPPLLFTEDEAVAVTLELLTARQAGMALAVEGALAKVERVLPTAVAERVRALEETIGFAPERIAPVPTASATSLALSAATRDRRCIRIR